jgi:hypothetical protein
MVARLDPVVARQYLRVAPQIFETAPHFIWCGRTNRHSHPNGGALPKIDPPTVTPNPEVLP